MNSTRPRFFDSSALVKRFSPENGSIEVDRAFAGRDSIEYATSWICMLEVVSVLVRKRNSGGLSERQCGEALAAVRSEWVDSNAIRLLRPRTDDFLEAMKLVPRHNINASDALILECARRWFAEVGPGEFWTSDRRLVRAARAEGMLVVDPADLPDLQSEAARPIPAEP